ncbi:MAG: LysR family transcriptional regulator [Saprospiraceae bacterium]|nr:LysR family transcriptional regulator [Saprospiraceae bacterium]
MNYTLNQLQVFLKIAETGSITKAAEALHLSQPAVSIQLKNFQDQFDIPLTELVGRRIYITDFGKEIAEAVENIIHQVHAINNKTLAYKGQLFGRLKMAVVSTGKYVMPYFLAGFIEQHQGIELRMDVTNRAQVIDSLMCNEVDFALVSIVPQGLRVDNLELFQNKLFLIGNAEARLKRGRNGNEIFKDLPLIFREKGSGTRQTMEKFIESNDIPALKRLELASNEAVKQAVLAGLGYSIMSLVGVKNELYNNDLQIIPVEGLPIKTMWSLIWLPNKKLSPVANAFLEYMREEKSQIIQNKFDWYEQY